MVKVCAGCGLHKTGISPGSFHAAPRFQQLRHAPQLPGAVIPGRFVCAWGHGGGGNAKQAQAGS
nr:MAG TPA: hypothetical protein [Caudoviricetes sp.]